MAVHARKEGTMLIVSVQGRMGEVSAPEFEENMRQFIEEGETSFIVDLSELEYISSAGLRSILAIAKMLKEKNGRIVLTGLTGAVKDVFEISEFVSIFDIYDSLEAALAEQ